MKHYFSRASREYLPFVRSNAPLFLGIALFLLGAMNWSRGRYCDGNPADYYSCTNPATYYYYSPLAIVLCIVGVFCVALWFLKRFER